MKIVFSGDIYKKNLNSLLKYIYNIIFFIQGARFTVYSPCSSGASGTTAFAQRARTRDGCCWPTPDRQHPHRRGRPLPGQRQA